jgi:hypothetical protein
MQRYLSRNQSSVVDWLICEIGPTCQRPDCKEKYCRDHVTLKPGLELGTVPKSGHVTFGPDPRVIGLFRPSSHFVHVDDIINIYKNKNCDITVSKIEK